MYSRKAKGFQTTVKDKKERLSIDVRMKVIPQTDHLVTVYGIGWVSKEVAYFLNPKTLSKDACVLWGWAEGT